MEEPPTFLSETDCSAKEGSPTSGSNMAASQHEPLTPQSQTSLQQFKLRSSCDACGQAKPQIKCDRGQPACARCVAQGASCVYGVSRKAGKPPRRRPTTHSPYLSRPIELEVTSIDLGGAGHDNHDGGIDLNRGGHDSIDIMLGLTEGAVAVDSPFPASDAAFQTWVPFDSFGSPGAFKSAWTSGDIWMGGQISSSTTASSTAASAAGRPYCTQESRDIMRHLYCANPSAPISDGVPARTLDLDSILTRNREVVGRLRVLLKCPCARSSHTAMLYSSIASRVLLWYQQAACNASSVGPSRLSLPRLPPTSTGQEPLPYMPNSAALKAFDGAADDGSSMSVLPTPVMLGSFQSDDGNVQTALTNCLILSELRRVGGLIDAFISLGTAPPESPMAGDACPAAGEFSTNVADASLFATLGAWLQTEHRRIVRKARAGLSVLDDNLGF